MPVINLDQSLADRSLVRILSSSRFVASICCTVIALISMPSATAQELLETQELPGSPDLVDLSPTDAWESVVSLASTDEALVQPVSSEITELQARVSQLDRQIALLQSQQARTRVNGSASTGQPKLFAAFESVIVQPTLSNKTGVIVETPGGFSNVSFPWQIEHSPRVSFGYDSASENLGWRVRWWQFRHSESFAAGPENGLIPTGFEGVVGFLSEDGDVTTGLSFIEEGDFTSHVRTDVIDLELQRRLTKAVNLYAGIRYGKLKQSYFATTDRGIANSDSEFRGIGPTLALQFEHQLPLDRLVLFSNVRGSLLLGRQDFSVVDDVNFLRQSLNEIDLTGNEEGANSLATNAEMQLGIRYNVSKLLSFTVAIEAQHFGNVGGANPTAVFAGPDSGLTGDSPLDDDLSFLGLNFGTQLHY